MDVEEVKRWVMTSLIGAVILMHSIAVAALGAFGPDRAGARQGLFVIATLLAALAIGAIRLVHKLPLLTPWYVAAVIPPTLVYLAVLGF